jgi:small subunit ribosomal protein S4
MKLFLKGSKCESPKCPIEIRPYPPGEHGRGRTKDSEYLLQKREKTGDYCYWIANWTRFA